MMISIKQVDGNDYISGSLASSNLVSIENLVFGRMPEGPYESLIDKMVLNNVLNETEKVAKMSGITETEQFLGRELKLENTPNINGFKLVGIVDTGSPSIYVDDSMLINITTLSSGENGFRFAFYDASTEEPQASVWDYNLFSDKIELKKGNYPENDYEVIVNISHKEEMPLNKTIKEKVNDKKLKVVGYYESKYNIDNYLVNSNTLKYKTITEKSGFIVSTKNIDSVIEKLREQKLNVKSSYESTKEDYLKAQKETIKNSLTVSGIILAISLVEIFLMIRSSFLSRIKEIGILRAIGVKKKDIYKMFVGEIIAITTLASVPGILLMSYILKVVSTIKYFEKLLVVDFWIVTLSIVFVYIFNLLVGLLPVHRVVRKTPAQILSRHDI